MFCCVSLPDPFDGLAGGLALGLEQFPDAFAADPRIRDDEVWGLL